MAVNRYRYYLGPEGNMLALPGMPGGSDPETTLRIPAAEHVSLSGRTTQDRIFPARVRRTWKMSWMWLAEDDELAVQAAYRLAARSPLRLLDPRKRNTFPEDVSTCGSTTASIASFTDVGAATPVWTPATTAASMPVELFGLVGGRIVWNSVTNTQTLHATAERHPIFAGSTYRVSVFVKSTTTFNFSIRPFDIAGAEQTTVNDGTSQTSTAGVWLRKSFVYTPAAGITSAYFGIRATGSGNIETAGWQVQVDDTLRNWAFGYGVPAVTLDPEAAASYYRTKYHNFGIVAKEV